MFGPKGMKGFFGRGPWRGHGFDPRRGRVFGKGDLKYVILDLIKDQRSHGYEVMRALEGRFRGFYSPSPGSVYPTLQMLEDEGFARSTEHDGKRVYEITDEGRVESGRRVDAAGGVPWERRSRGSSGFGELREAVGALGFAARQLAGGATEEQVRRATEIVNDARKQIYRLLADD